LARTRCGLAGGYAALIYTLLGTAKLNGIDPNNWLRNTLDVIDGYPKDRIHELLPLKQAE
jgi:transposase